MVSEKNCLEEKLAEAERAKKSSEKKLQQVRREEGSVGADVEIFVGERERGWFHSDSEVSNWGSWWFVRESDVFATSPGRCHNWCTRPYSNLPIA